MREIELLIKHIESNNLWNKELVLNKNEFLKESGSVDTNIYFIEKGSLRLYVVNDQLENTIRFGYQNNMIVALDCFINNEPSDFYIQAIKKTKVKVLNKDTYFELINNSDQFKTSWTKILETLILQQIEREKDLLINSPIERYKRVLKRSPQLFQEIPNKYIADYLRMTPETFSRIKKS